MLITSSTKSGNKSLFAEYKNFFHARNWFGELFLSLRKVINISFRFPSTAILIIFTLFVMLFFASGLRCKFSQRRKFMHFQLFEMCNLQAGKKSIVLINFPFLRMALIAFFRIKMRTESYRI